MLTYIFIAVLVIAWIIIVRDIMRAPLEEEDYDDIDDPTTTFWHDDDDHPNESL